MDECQISDTDNKYKHLQPPYGVVDTKPETPTPETLAASVMAENTSEEVDRILKVWSEIFGMRLNPERVRDQLATLREWQGQWTRIRKRTSKV